MINSTFVFTSPDLWPLVTAVGLAVILLIRELLQSYSHKRKLINATVSMIAVVALGLIAMRPAVMMKADIQKIIVLTPGFTATQLDSLKKEDPGYQIIGYDTLHFAVQQNMLNTSQLTILGDGVPEEELPLWAHGAITYIQNNRVHNGVTRLLYNERRSEGDQLEVKGEIMSGDEGWLNLVGLGGSLDSVAIKKGLSRFSLSTSLKQSGRFVYTLQQIEEDGDTLQVGHLPVLVEPKKKVKILMINQFPTFEQKYVKNFLISEGHEVVVRSQITKDRFNYEFYNTSFNQRFTTLNEEVLSHFDLFVTDHETVSTYKTTTRNRLEQRLKEGLGLFVLPDDRSFVHATQMPFTDFTWIEETGEEETLVLDGLKQRVSVYAHRANASADEQAVFNNRMIYRRVGLGKSGTMAIKNSYELVLKGETRFYQILWKQIIEEMVFRPSLTHRIQAFPLIEGKPYEIKIRDYLPDSNRPLSVNETSLAMQQDPHLPTTWTTTYWPEKTGWQAITGDQLTDSLWFYVQSDKDWLTLRLKNRQIANNRVFEAAQIQELGKVQQIKAIPVWIFYGLFVISMAYLWLEPKLV